MCLGKVEHRPLQSEYLEGLKHKEEKGHVSVIYYPVSKKILYGHMRLEIEGECWNLTDNTGKTEVLSGVADTMSRAPEHPWSLSLMIENARNKGKRPFYRYHVRVTLEQLKNLKENVLNEKSFSCSYAVMSCLTKYAGLQMPLPLRIIAMNPTATGLYLEACGLGSRKIYKVEQIGLPSHFKAMIRDLLILLLSAATPFFILMINEVLSDLRDK